MTATTPTHVDSSIPEVWARLTLRDQLRPGFFARFVGPEGSRSPLIRVTDLVNKPGDAVNIQITDPLAGAGVEGDTAELEGNEENLDSSAIKTIPKRYRHGVRWHDRAAKKSILDLRSEGRMRLAEWGGEKMDDIRFTNFLASGTLNGETYVPETFSLDVGDGGVPGDVDTGEYLTVAGLQRVKLQAYNNRAMPLMTSDGEEFFAMVVHPNTLYGLKRESEYRDWIREAHVRGADNPFFKGATAMIDGILLFQHSNVPTALDGAGGISVSRNMLFGAEAFVEGLDQDVRWAEDTFDYGDQFGIAYSFAFQPRRGLAKNSLIVYASAETPTA